MSHADLLTTTVFRFTSEALVGQFDPGRCPALVAHTETCKAMPAFRAIYQPYELAPPSS